jgi:hypothetical protein
LLFSLLTTFCSDRVAMRLCGSFLVLLVFASNTFCALSPNEKASLDELYVATGGSGWKLPNNWLTETDYCLRTGVVCNFTQDTVLGIDLPNVKLTGSLPSLSNLTNLKNLYDPIPSIVRHSHLPGSCIPTRSMEPFRIGTCPISS